MNNTLRGLLTGTTLALAATGAHATVIDGFGTIEDTTNITNITGFIPSAALTSNTPAGTGRTSFGSFDISVSVSGSPSQSQIDAFTAAELYWESQITGYETQALADGMVSATGGAVQISAVLEPGDGPGGVLGSAGATGVLVTNGDINVTPDENNVMVTTSGSMNFDTHDLDSLETAGTLGDVIRHEMGHVLGFTNFFWERIAAVDQSGTDTSYTGPIALATYQNEFAPASLFIPVEESGGPGTAFAHWDEDLFNNHLLVNGNSANPEIMTGFLEGPTYTSDTTLASFDDLGYVTIVTDNAINAVPVPAPALMLLSGMAALGLRRRKH